MIFINRNRGLFFVALFIVSAFSQNINFHGAAKIMANGNFIDNPFGAPCFADWDNDGVQDLLVGEMVRVPAETGSLYGKLAFYKNSGTKNNPSLNAAEYIKAGGVDIEILAG